MRTDPRQNLHPAAPHARRDCDIMNTPMEPAVATEESSLSKMSYIKGLRCRECGRHYRPEAIFVCEYCFGSLEVDYDYERIRQVFTRQLVESRPCNLWRYRELLPIDGDPLVGFDTGFTPLYRAERLGHAPGGKNLYIKDDSVCHP